MNLLSRCMQKNLAVRGLLIALLLLIAAAAVTADEGSFVFTGPHLRVFFQPRIRANIGEALSATTEIARLNYAVNFFNNYLEYLIKLQKIATTTMISLDYNPEGGDEAFSQRVAIRDLGFNNILKTLNNHLIQQPGTARSRLLSEKEALLTIGDHLERASETVEEALGFQNLSLGLRSLAPEHEFVVLGPKAVVSIRPLETGNELILTKEATGVVLLPPDPSGEYAHLTASPDGRYLAFTTDGKPQVMDMANKKLLPVFPGDPQKKILDMEWSPRLNRLGGMVLDGQTMAREIFVFDTAGEKRNRFVEEDRTISGDYQYSYPFWSPDGQKILFCSGDEIHLIDLAAEKSYAQIVQSKGGIAEMLWSGDNQSFAYVEVFGQARSSNEFDDLDFLGSALHRMCLKPDAPPERYAPQTIVSSHTLKLVSFWSRDRVLYLEGALKSQRVRSCHWDLSQVFSAQLTPSGPGGLDAGGRSLGPTNIPMAFCQVFKSIDAKFTNLYDAGMGHQNYQFLDLMKNSWFIGIQPPEGVVPPGRNYSLRSHPYPFLERNQMFLCTLTQDQITAILDFFRTYDIRRFELLLDEGVAFFLSNSVGPLSLWTGSLDRFYQQKLPMPIVEGETGEGAETGTSTASEAVPVLRFAPPATTGSSTQPAPSLPDLPF